MNAAPLLNSPIERQDILSYFSAQNNRPFTLNEFSFYWEQIETLNLSPKEAVNILRFVAGNISNHHIATRDIYNYLTRDKRINVWIEAVRGKLHDFKPIDISDTSKHFGKLAILPDISFLQELKNCAIEKMPHSNSIDVSNLLWGFARLGVHPGDDLMDLSMKNLLLNKFKNKKNTMHDIGPAAWAIAIISALKNSRDMKTGMHILMAQHRNDPLNNIANTQIDMAALWFGLPEFRKHSIHTREHASYWERQLHDSFLNNKFTLNSEKNSYIPELWRKADFRLSHNDRDIMIEADGPAHFVYDVENSRLRYDGPTYFSNAAIEWLYPDTSVIRLRYDDCETLGTDTIAPRIKRLFNKLAPGTHVTSVNRVGLKLQPMDRIIELAPAPLRAAQESEIIQAPQSVEAKAETEETPEAVPLNREEILRHFVNMQPLECASDFTRNFLPYWRMLPTQEFSPQDLTQILASTHNAFCSPHTPGHVYKELLRPGLFSCWYKMAYRSGDFDTHFLCTNLHNFARMNILPPDHFMTEWHNEANSQIDSFTPDELILTIRSFAKLGIVPEKQFMQGWVSAIGHHVKELTDDDMATLARCMAVFHVISDDPQYRQVGEFFLDSLNGKGMSQKFISKANQARLLFDRPLKKTRVGGTDERGSSWETSLEFAFRQKGFENQGGFISQLNRKVDFHLKYDGREIIIEADGPSHFIKDEPLEKFHFNGSTLLQTALLRKLHPDAVIIRLRYLDMNGFKALHHADPHDQGTLADKLAELFKTTPPGAYQTEFEHDELLLKPVLAADIKKANEIHMEPLAPAGAPEIEAVPETGNDIHVEPNTLSKLELLNSTYMQSPLRQAWNMAFQNFVPNQTTKLLRKIIRMHNDAYKHFRFME